MNGSFFVILVWKYLFDAGNGEDLFKKYGILNLYYNKVTNTRSDKDSPENHS